MTARPMIGALLVVMALCASVRATRVDPRWDG